MCPVVHASPDPQEWILKTLPKIKPWPQFSTNDIGSGARNIATPDPAYVAGASLGTSQSRRRITATAVLPHLARLGRRAAAFAAGILGATAAVDLTLRSTPPAESLRWPMLVFEDASGFLPSGVPGVDSLRPRLCDLRWLRLHPADCADADEDGDEPIQLAQQLLLQG
jgi:hypothetical protein